MNKIKFAIPLAITLSIVSFLSCSKEEEAVIEAQCSLDQGEWDKTTKKCVKCPDGTIKRADGKCVVSADAIVQEDGKITIVCPAGTKLDEKSNVCVANIIEVDPNATAGKYYCDYGEPDPKATSAGEGCVEIKYKEECDSKWGKLVSSCKEADRRPTDDIKYCDYGSSGGCYQILNDKDCDEKYGKVVNSCGNTVKKYCDQGKPYIDGKDGKDGYVQGGCFSITSEKESTYCLSDGYTIVDKCPKYNCPTGTTEIINYWGDFACEPIKKEDPPPSTLYCFDGKTNCYKISSDKAESEKCYENGNKVVTNCEYVAPPTSSASSSTLYCFDGKTNCYKISSDKAESEKCYENGGKVVTSCDNYVPTSSASSSTSSSPYYCDYGPKYSTATQQEGGGCFGIKDKNECSSEGKLVSSCQDKDRRTDLNFCDQGKWTTDKNGKITGGCWLMKPDMTTQDKNDCYANGGTIVPKCSWLN